MNLDKLIKEINFDYSFDYDDFFQSYDGSYRRASWNISGLPKLENKEKLTSGDAFDFNRSSIISSLYESISKEEYEEWEKFIEQFRFLRMKATKPDEVHHNAKPFYLIKHEEDINDYISCYYLWPNADNQKVYHKIREIAFLRNEQKRKDYRFLKTTLVHPLHDKIEKIFDCYIKKVHKLKKDIYKKENFCSYLYFTQFHVDITDKEVNFLFSNEHIELKELPRYIQVGLEKRHIEKLDFQGERHITDFVTTYNSNDRTIIRRGSCEERNYERINTLTY